MTDERCTLRLTRRYEATVEEVWDALLDGRWLGIADANVRAVEHHRLAEVDLPGSVARIELSRDGETTLLVLEHANVLAPVGMRGMRIWTDALERLDVA